MSNEWTVTHAKHQIRVAKTQCSGARLSVDGELLDTTNDLYANEGEATLVGVFGENDEFRVEAFASSSVPFPASNPLKPFLKSFQT